MKKTKLLTGVLLVLALLFAQVVTAFAAPANQDTTGITGTVTTVVHPDKPTRPGQVEKREFEYDRHGTQALIAGFEVATGKDLVRVSLAQTAAPREFPVDYRPA